MAASKKKISRDEIEDAPVPPSPRRQKKNMTCGVLSKSPLKSTRNDGRMFSLSLCDEKQTNTIRAVCFDERLYEASKTYDLQDFVVKKSFTSSKSVELKLDKNTKVSEAERQMTLENQNFTVCEILRGNVSGVVPINLKAKVIEIEDVYTVGAHPDEKSKREVIIGDCTGSMTLVLWRERAENVEFQAGDVLQLNNMGINSFNNTFSLTTTFETSIVKTEEEMIVKAIPKPVKKSSSSCEYGVKCDCYERLHVYLQVCWMSSRDQD